jgi:IS5 family transposase
MHQTKKSNQWRFGTKAHTRVDAESALVHTVIGTAANVGDITQVADLMHGQETEVFAETGYWGAAKQYDAEDIPMNWHADLRPGKRRALDKNHQASVSWIRR